MSRQSDKARAAWLDRYRAALVQACGAAAILGDKDHAATLCELIDAARVDNRAKKCYNASSQRRQARKTEGKTMKIYAFYMTAETGERFALCENGLGIGSTYTINATTAAEAAEIFDANVDIDLTGSEYAAEIAPEQIAERPHDFTPLPIW